MQTTFPSHSLSQPNIMLFDLFSQYFTLYLNPNFLPTNADPALLEDLLSLPLHLPPPSLFIRVSAHTTCNDDLADKLIIDDRICSVVCSDRLFTSLSSADSFFVSATRVPLGLDEDSDDDCPFVVVVVVVVVIVVSDTGGGGGIEGVYFLFVGGSDCS